MTKTVLFSLMTAAFYAGGYILSKESTRRLSFWNGAVICDAGILLVSLLCWPFVTPSLSSAKEGWSFGGFLALMAGIVWGIGGWCCYKSLDEGDLWLVAAITLLVEVAFASGYGMIFLGERFVWRDVAGIGFVLIGVFIIMFGKMHS